MSNKNEIAFISNEGRYICFSYNGRNVRFRGPYSLVRFDKVKQWDNGYLVVDAFFEHEQESVEDYIDLVSILEDLYIDPKEFLKGIKDVEVKTSV